MSVGTNHDRILILDFGGQYSQLIARRVRECGVYCEIWPYTASLEKIQGANLKGIFMSGGPSSVYDEKAPKVDPKLFELGIPIFGICYGMQLIAKEYGGQVERAENREYGVMDLTLASNPGILATIQEDPKVLMTHGDVVCKAPEGFLVTASTNHTPVAGMENAEKHLYGFQFHPEVVDTVKGLDLIRHFLFDICKCKGDWDMGSFAEEQSRMIKEKVGDKKVLCALSGGVDSSVAAVLVHRAIGDQLTCVYVDHGFMRKDESAKVVKTFRDGFHINLVHVDARERFMGRIAGITDPEEKRKRIGEEFIRLFEDEARKLGQIDFLVQGTVYPDVVESGTDTAAVIKSHHNVGGLPEDMHFSLIEPLRELFKDEVRKLGLAIDVPEEIVWRQPFPGPGLAIRIIGEITEEKLEIVREADAIVREEITNAGLYRQIWQAFAVLPGLKSVGVMGDERTYDYTVGLRIVSSEDAMTADWVRLPYEILDQISKRIVNEVKGVNRIVYDITSKPPSTIEWE